MEILELIGIPYFKKGKGIHIKKKNRGKFTEYCGGKVTDECIRKAKKSKNPKLRKRATFAANARKWKHQEGGVLTKFETGGPVKTFDINTPIALTQYWDDYIAENSVPFSVIPEAPVDQNELAKRQAWAESSGNNQAKSRRGAKGKYQIMPKTLKEYKQKTKDYGDVYDPKYNRRVRDYEFNRYDHTNLVNNGNPSDSVKWGRKLAIYNYGFGNVRDAINKAEAAGVNTTTNFDWLEYLPKETRDYVNFVLRGKDTGAHRTNYNYINKLK